MPDFIFTPTWATNSYPARAQRSAVLFALTKRACKTSLIGDKTLCMVSSWRRRLDELAAVGWYPTRNHDSQYVRNCLPTFVYTKQRTKPCAIRHLCPFCYARWVGDTWENIDACFPNTRTTVPEDKVELGDNLVGHLIPEDTFIPTDDSGRSRVIDLGTAASSRGRDFPYHMITTRVSQTMSLTSKYDNPVTNLRYVMNRSIEHRVELINGGKGVAGYRPLGALHFTTIAPAKEEGRIEVVWRSLMLVTPDHPDPGEEWLGRIRRDKTPSRKSVFKAVVRTCRYPTGLMYGDPVVLKHILDARKGASGPGSGKTLRMYANFGVFRKSRKDFIRT